MLGGKNLGNEIRVINTDGASHEWSQTQVEPLHNTTSGA